MLALAFVVWLSRRGSGREVNVYSSRQDELIKPIIQQFEKSRASGQRGSPRGAERASGAEGKLSPADLMLTVDISRLTDLVDKGLVQPVDSKILQRTSSAIYRDPDNRWFALTTRVRAIYSSKDRLGKLDTISYEDLAKPEFKGKICTRSGKHEYNVALVSS
jgi:iron(III) transport system substrate-binding protein